MRKRYVLSVSKNRIKQEERESRHSNPSRYPKDSNEHLFFMFRRSKYLKTNLLPNPDLRSEDFVWDPIFGLEQQYPWFFDEAPPSNGDECQCDVCQGRATDSMILHRARHETKVRGWDNTKVFYEDDGLGEMP